MGRPVSANFQLVIPARVQGCSVAAVALAVPDVFSMAVRTTLPQRAALEGLTLAARFLNLNVSLIIMYSVWLYSDVPLLLKRLFSCKQLITSRSMIILILVE